MNYNINRNTPCTPQELSNFLYHIDFNLPIGFLLFYEESNGAEISSTNEDITIWPLKGLIQTNQQYCVEEFAPDFFLFGTNSAGLALSFQKSSGHIFWLPFIGMLMEDSIFISKDFHGFICQFNID